MKFRNLLLLATASLFILGSTSCYKKYTCRCKQRFSGYAGLPDSTYKEYEITDTKENAKSSCQGESNNYNNNYIKTVDSCYLY
jgi:hypothetical protein